MKTSCPCCADQISMCSSKIRFSTSVHVAIVIAAFVIAIAVAAVSWGITR